MADDKTTTVPVSKNDNVTKVLDDKVNVTNSTTTSSTSKNDVVDNTTQKSMSTSVDNKEALTNTKTTNNSINEVTPTSNVVETKKEIQEDTAKSSLYTVKLGDDIATIATSYGISVGLLKRLNYLESNFLIIGMQLKTGL